MSTITAYVPKVEFVEEKYQEYLSLGGEKIGFSFQEVFECVYAPTLYLEGWFKDKKISFNPNISDEIYNKPKRELFGEKVPYNFYVLNTYIMKSYELLNNKTL